MSYLSLIHIWVMPVPEEEIVLKERLHPGKILLVDTRKGQIFSDDEIKEIYAKKQPYGEWLDSNLVELHDLKIPNIRVEEYEGEELTRMQKAFGYTYEDYRKAIYSMARNGSEAVSYTHLDVYKRQI